jgi:hypothetical protein
MSLKFRGKKLVAGIADYSRVPRVAHVELRHWCPGLIFYFHGFYCILCFYEEDITIVV